MKTIADLHKHVRDEYEDFLSSKSCNDIQVEDNPEMRALWDEAQAWSFKTDVEQIKHHAEYIEPPAHNGKLYIDDRLCSYVLYRAIQFARCGAAGVPPTGEGDFSTTD